MKKLLSILLITSFLLSLIGCEGTSNSKEVQKKETAPKIGEKNKSDKKKAEGDATPDASTTKTTDQTNETLTTKTNSTVTKSSNTSKNSKTTAADSSSKTTITNTQPKTQNTQTSSSSSATVTVPVPDPSPVPAQSPAPSPSSDSMTEPVPVTRSFDQLSDDIKTAINRTHIISYVNYDPDPNTKTIIVTACSGRVLSYPFDSSHAVLNGSMYRNCPDTTKVAAAALSVITGVNQSSLENVINNYFIYHTGGPLQYAENVKITYDSAFGTTVAEW